MDRLVIAALLLVILLPGSVFAQDKFHIIPQVADGAFGDGTYYKSTFMVLPWFESTAATCSLRLYGLSVNLANVRSDTFNLSLAAGTHYIQTTASDQAFDSGYATLTCSDYVFVQALYSFYAANGTKISEATVFSSEGEFNVSKRLFLDQREGARLAVAIANNTDIARTYRLTFGSMVATTQVSARSSLARFVGELMTIPANAAGLLRVESTDFSTFGVIGLRFTGGAFTTIPSQ